jgi:hypothetical protein
MRFSWTFKRRMAALSGIVMVLQGAGLSQAQFAPISNPSQTYGQQTPVASQQYAQPKTYGQLGNYAQAKPQSFGQATQPSYGQVAQQVQAQQPVQVPQQVQAPQQNYVQPQQPSYTQLQQPRIAYNPPINQNFSQYQANGQTQQTFGQTTNVPVYTAKAFQDSVAQQPTVGAATQGGNGLAAPAMNGSATSYGNGVGYNTFDQGCGVGNYGCRKGCRRWFGGVYGLMMERDSRNYNIPLAFATTSATPYYPTAPEIAMTSSDASTEFQAGMEIRIGATLTGHLAQSCGIGSRGVGYNTFAGGGCSSACCGPTLAWEAVYWGLTDEPNTQTIYDVTGDATRTYSMMDFAGWEYDPGTGYRPVNDYYDYGSPTEDHTAPYDIEVRSFTVRRNFSTQNLELNLLRLPILNGCSSGCCDTGCDTGCCGAGSRGCGPRYEMTTLCGARFMRFDDDFMFGSNYERMDSNVLGSLAFNSELENQLYGLQIGSKAACRFGRCGRWGVHCDTSVGVFGNSISSHQWMTGARYAGGANEDFDVSTSKDEISFLGEMRVGASYQYSCNWRLYGGWRVIGISGVATATDQITSTPATTGWIDSSGSLILHGLQAGVSCSY